MRTKLIFLSLAVFLISLAALFIFNEIVKPRIFIKNESDDLIISIDKDKSGRVISRFKDILSFNKIRIVEVQITKDVQDNEKKFISIDGSSATLITYGIFIEQGKYTVKINISMNEIERQGRDDVFIADQIETILYFALIKLENPNGDGLSIENKRKEFSKLIYDETEKYLFKVTRS